METLLRELTSVVLYSSPPLACAVVCPLPCTPCLTPVTVIGHPIVSQAIWFLNGFWEDGIEESAEDIWTWYKNAVALDKCQHPPKGEAGCELDPFWSAKFLEDQEEALTAVQRKQAMQEIDVDNNGKMALVEYLYVALR